MGASCSTSAASVHAGVAPDDNPAVPHYYDAWAAFTQPRKIQALERWPDGTLYEPWATDEDAGDVVKTLRGKPVVLSELFAGKRTVLVGLPGAFTPNCSRVHLPQYIQHADDFYAAGIDQIVVMVANDPCVVQAWSDATNARAAGIRIMSDRNCDVAQVSAQGFICRLPDAFDLASATLAAHGPRA